MNSELRKKIRMRSGGICERCAQYPAEHMHHLTYARFGEELPTDIEHICLQCHGEYHPHHTFRPLEQQRVIADIRKKKRDKLNNPKKPSNPWKQMEHEAKKALRKSAQFNQLPISRRRSY